MKKVFYCNECKLYNKDFDDKNIKHTFTNPRDGWGKMIEHVVCPKCGNVLSGFVRLYKKDECSKEGMEYYKEVIKMYQLNHDEGGYLKDKDKLIDSIKNPKPKKKHIHKYKYIKTDEYGFNEYRCLKCNREMWINSLYDKNPKDFEEEIWY